MVRCGIRYTDRCISGGNVWRSTIHYYLLLFIITMRLFPDRVYHILYPIVGPVAIIVKNI